MDLRIPSELSITGNLELNWLRWKQKFKNYLIATEKIAKGDETKIAIFLTLIGDDGIKIYNTIKKIDLLNTKNEESFDKVVEEFEKLCVGKKNIVYERHCFLTYKRADGQSIDNYATELKIKAASCEYGSLVDSIIRDQVVLSITNQALQERLISITDLSLEKAVEIIKRTESAHEQVVQINSGKDDGISVNLVKKFASNKYGNRKNYLENSLSQKNNYTEKFNNKDNSHKQRCCHKCNREHEFGNCPAYGQTCRSCGHLNHWAVVCRRKKKAFVKEVRVQEAENGSSEEDESAVQLLGVYEVKENIGVRSNQHLKQPFNTDVWYEKIRLNNTITVSIKLDTGSQVNLLPFKIFKKLDNVKLSNTNVKLEAYGGFKLKPIGKVVLECTVKNQTSIKVTFLIINLDVQPLLGLTDCIAFGLIERKQLSCKIDGIQSDNVSKDKKELFINKNKEIFKGMGMFPGEYKIKIMKNAEGIIKPPRRVPQTVLEKLKKELDSLLVSGIIKTVEEPKQWSSNIVIVHKADGSLRLCLDPQELNKVIIREYILIPTLDDIRAKLVNKKYFSVLDIKKGFWHVKLDEDSTDLCTFSTPVGYFKFTRLPFGISCAPEAFIKRTQECFKDFDENNLIGYFDDYCVATETEEEHHNLIRKIVKRAKEMNIKFNESKLQYCKKEIKFMGHIINGDGMRPDPEQVKAITELKKPSCRVELQRIIGMCNYIREFIPNMATVISPLRELLKKDVLWEWKLRHEEAFIQLKKLIANPPVLAHFDPKKDIVIQSDASKDGLGCCLMQDKIPVAYASRSLSETEIRYGQIEKEFLSVVYACSKFRHFIYGRKIIAWTDHKPLVSIMNKNVSEIPSNRLQKMRIKLFEYDIELKYLPGKNMHIADLLSRNYIKSIEDSSEFDTLDIVHSVNRYNPHNGIYDLQKETREDKVLSKILDYCYNGWPKSNCVDSNVKLYFNMRNEIIINDNVIYYQQKIIVPNSLRPLILKLLHESHLGVTKTRMRAKNIFFWPGMLNEIEQYILRCKTCETFRSANKKNTLLLHEIPELPFEKVAADIMTYNLTNYIVLVDYWSKWLEIRPIKNKTATAVIAKFKKIFSCHGIPKTLIADNMPFNSSEFINFSKKWNFIVKTSSPEYPRSNGLAEKAVHISKQLLKKCQTEKVDLETALLEYRCTPIIELNASPSELLMSRLLRTKLPISKDKLKPTLQGNNYANLEKAQRKYKEWHDKRNNKKEVIFYEGQEVVVFKKDKWIPGKVISKADSPRSYWVEVDSGSKIRRNIWHLRPSFNEFRKSMSYTELLDLNESEEEEKSKKLEESEPQKSNSQESKIVPMTTRSGRKVKIPDRLNL